MAGPYSEGLRKRVVGAVDGGMSRRRAAGVFGVGISTVVNWVRRWRDTGSVAAKAMGGDHNSRLKGERAWLLERIEAVPDLTLEEIRLALQERGIIVGYGTVWRFFPRGGLSFKKKPARPPARAARCCASARPAQGRSQNTLSRPPHPHPPNPPAP